MPFLASRTGSGMFTAGFLAFGFGRAVKKALVYVSPAVVASTPQSWKCDLQLGRRHIQPCS